VAGLREGPRRNGGRMDIAATRALGRYGEQLACRYLSDTGLTILDRNWRCARGEIDIVARDAAALVVCEVKTRSGAQFGAPFEAVTRKKLQRLRRLAMLWLDALPADERGGLSVRTIRIDVVSIVKAGADAARITHLRGVL
jgi:putative endonuclease